MKLTTLKKRSEFLRLRGGLRCAMSTFVLETRPRTDKDTASTPPRFGFTVTKALGKAVDRNRMRRRLKAALIAIAPTCAKVGYDYVVIARRAALDRPFPELKSDLEEAFARVHRSRKT